jgi:hypothetical protein
MQQLPGKKNPALVRPFDRLRVNEASKAGPTLVPNIAPGWAPTLGQHYAEELKAGHPPANQYQLSCRVRAVSRQTRTPDTPFRCCLVSVGQVRPVRNSLDGLTPPRIRKQDCPPAEADQAAAAFARTGTFLAVSTFDSVTSRMPSLRVAFTPSGSILAGRSNTRKI